MQMWVRAAAIAAAATMAATFVSGCGVNKPASEAGSFGDAAAVALTDEHTVGVIGNVIDDNAAGSWAESGDTTGGVTVEGTSVEDGHTSSQATATPDKVNQESGNGGVQPSETHESDRSASAQMQIEQENSRSGTSGSLSSTLATPTLPSPTSITQTSETKQTMSTATPTQPTMTTTTPPKTTTNPTSNAAATTKPTASAESVDDKPDASNDSSAKTPAITWGEFFDNEDQTTPSERFWNLSDDRATVRIKGFMGEVLSISANWFLLIPEPGAECPFDNGDETYWNKIMIVFVKDGTKLRYTSKPLELTGRLDAGIKVDESGYKTMFRLYDATFKEIKG